MSKPRFIGVLAVWIVVILYVSGCGNEPATDPVVVAQGFQEAVNSQDVDSALEFFADDAVLMLDKTSPITGKIQIADWLAKQAILRFQLNGNPIASESGITFESCSISSDQWLFYGTNPMSGTCEVALEYGLITNFAIQFDENSQANLSDSPAAVSTDMVGIWTTRNYMDDSNNYLYLQFFEDGSGRLAVTPDDLLIAPDSDHAGASLTWTYENYVLSLQNDRVASEGYCQEQDVGKFLVKKVDGGGLRFKTINDSCSARGLAFKIPPRWLQHVP